ncbi:MAG: type II secretion system protein [Sulfurimonas sp.]|jgi:prepilin-type N-terminal cleavage/methylation domain-containing protein|uniref:pilus assembly FimT family protein n=1 Tax=unclassified Sulfurimonas TaxID=2623549 RepID=UPI0008CCCB94|nr:type II secretion system protein [Sulfurimonas sp. RIFOXYB12_FULL_35_9]MBS4067289.1 type II secretion system protein [Sulfurimonas sp.]OHE05449.1 MAG: N-terminal methylation [Sulfurimonas sp. RIFOXYB12_FULL_35_9]
MKKAFTMMELVFVIVVIGILAAVVMPRTGSNRLNEAAIQVVSHIRYTQHLAMIDDKFDTNPTSEWYKKRWQIFFSNTEDGSNNLWAYSIFSDGAGGSTGNPDVSELAVNPLNTSKLLTGGYSGTVQYNDLQGRNTKELLIGEKYSIVNVDFTEGCSIASNKQRIFFDNLGRPFYGSPHLQTKPYHNEINVKKLNSNCKITLTDNTGKDINISIEPETGYTYIGG